MEKRKHSARILLTVNSHKHAFALYPASEWQGETAAPGVFRVQEGRKWLNPGGEKVFMTASAIGQIVAERLAGGRGAAPAPRPEGFDKACRVALPSAEPDIEPHLLEAMNNDPELPAPVQTRVTGWTMAPPHPGPDGGWWIWVLLAEGKRLVPVDALARLRR